jgi:O-antigen ligase
LAASTVFLGWRLARRQRVITMAVMFIAISLFIVFAPGGYGNRVAGIVGSQDGSVIARTDDLKRSILVMARHPLFGVGINNYVLRSNNNIVTHNAYTQIGAEMGIAAMVIYILFIITPFKRLRQIERETAESRRTDARFYYLAVGLQASLVGYMVSSFFASVSYLWNVYYLVGYASCLYWLYTARTNSVTTNNADQRVS